MTPGAEKLQLWNDCRGKGLTVAQSRAVITAFFTEQMEQIILNITPKRTVITNDIKTDITAQAVINEMAKR